MLAAHGASVLDADQVARDVVRPGTPAYVELVRLFGSEIVFPTGELNRQRLGALVFSDLEKRAQLNAVTHPQIAIQSAARLEQLRQSGAALAVYEASLLVENGSYRAFDGLLVVHCRVELQVERAMARVPIDGVILDEAQIRARIAAQAPQEAKIAAATWLIDSSGAIDDVRRQVDALWPELTNGLLRAGQS